MTRGYRLGAVLRLASLAKERSRREFARTTAAEHRSASEAARLVAVARALDEERSSRHDVAHAYAGAAAAAGANANVAAHRARLVTGLAAEAEDLAAAARIRTAACRAALREAARDLEMQQGFKDAILARIRRDEKRAMERRETEAAVESWAAHRRTYAD